MEELSDDRFYDALNNEDHLGMVIRAHLYIEYEKKLQFTYYTKILLCCSLGLIKELEGPLNVIGTLRNNFAHNIGTTLDNSTVSSIYKILSGNHQKQLKSAYEQMALQFNREEKKFTALTDIERLGWIFVFIRKKLKQANTQLEKSLGLNGI